MPIQVNIGPWEKAAPQRTSMYIAVHVVILIEREIQEAMGKFL